MCAWVWWVTQSPRIVFIEYHCFAVGSIAGLRDSLLGVGLCHHLDGRYVAARLPALSLGS